MTIAFQPLSPFPQHATSIDDPEVKRWFDVAAKAMNSLQDVFILNSLFTNNGFQSRISQGNFSGRNLTNADGYVSITNADGIAGNPILSLQNLPISDVKSKKLNSIFYGTLPVYFNVTSIGVSSAGTEDTLHNYDIAANSFSNNLDRMTVEMAGQINDTGGFNTYIRLYIGGTKCFDTGNFTPSTIQYWSLKSTITRTSSTQAQIICDFFSSDISLKAICATSSITVDFTSTTNIKITGIGFFVANVIEQWITSLNYEKRLL